MDRDLRFPRAVLCVRAALYAAGTVALGVLALATLGFLSTVVAVGGLALVVADASPAVVVGVAVVGVLLSTLAAGGIAVGVRRVDRRVRALARRPDPVERLRAAYVAGEIDEATFERRVERVLDPTRSGPGAHGRDRSLARRLATRGRRRLRTRALADRRR
jgi:hypothetical protein